MQNKIAKIKDAHKRQQVTEICKQLQQLYINPDFSNKHGSDRHILSPIKW